MSKKLSISIPYKQRIDNLALAFEGLARQTMPRSDFEVIVGAMEYCEDYITLCKQYIDKIDIISVVSGDDFSIPRARNLAMRQARGEIVVQMDADTLLPVNALKNLYNRHFSFKQKVCVIGQVVGYDNNNDGDVHSVDVKSYSMYEKPLKELVESKGNPKDPRFQVDHIIPWAFGWTGFISLPKDIIQREQLYFDEEFSGWGVDDLEWSYRICSSGIPMILCEDVCAIHLPHIRNQSENQKTERKNYRRFLKKWPRLDVELAYVFGDVKANSLYLSFMSDLHKVYVDALPIVIRGKIDKKDVLIVGGEIKDTKLVDENIIKQFDSFPEILPILGMALPYQNKEIDESRILSKINNLPDLYLSPLQNEVERISKIVLHVD